MVGPQHHSEPGHAHHGHHMAHNKRDDHHAMHHGHPPFGKSGGGHGGLKSKLVSSPMSPGMTPKKGGKSLHGKSHGQP